MKINLKKLFFLLKIQLILLGLTSILNVSLVEAKSSIRNFFRFVDSPVGKVQPVISYQMRYYFEQPVRNQNTDFEMLYQEGTVLVPFWQNSQDEVSWIMNVRNETISTQAFLPDQNIAFPSALWDLRFGPNYRHRFKNDWVVGTSILFGSASNEPFNSTDDLELAANFFLKIPAKNKKDYWFVFLNYSNNREFLNQIPLPGFGYWFKTIPWFRGLVGLPLMGFEFVPHKTTTLGFFYFPARNIVGELAYQPYPFLRFFSYFQWSNERYFRANRPDTQDRLFYYEKQVGAGFTLRPTSFMEWSTSGGYAFDRFYFEGRNYSDRFNDRIDIGSGPFISTRLSFRFGKNPYASRGKPKQTETAPHPFNRLAGILGGNSVIQIPSNLAH